MVFFFEKSPRMFDSSEPVALAGVEWPQGGWKVMFLLETSTGRRWKCWRNAGETHGKTMEPMAFCGWILDRNSWKMVDNDEKWWKLVRQHGPTAAIRLGLPTVPVSSPTVTELNCEPPKHCKEASQCSTWGQETPCWMTRPPIGRCVWYTFLAGKWCSLGLADWLFSVYLCNCTTPDECQPWWIRRVTSKTWWFANRELEGFPPKNRPKNGQHFSRLAMTGLGLRPGGSERPSPSCLVALRFLWNAVENMDTMDTIRYK